MISMGYVSKLLAYSLLPQVTNSFMVVGLRSLKIWVVLSVLCVGLCFSDDPDSLPSVEPETVDETLVTEDPVIRRFLESFPSDEDSRSTVLLIGETGVGKELIAHELHTRSPRATQPFVVVDCGNITSTLAESELFGHKKGSFTGADHDRKSVFETAEGGTVFLDEIENLDLRLQAKLLRALDIDPTKRRISPTGSLHESTLINVRIIAATNVDLRELVDQGTFRQDLYYRLNIRTLKIPPLRERHGDLTTLADHFVRVFSQGTKNISSDLRLILTLYQWPGNVRELKNVILKMCLFSENTDLVPEDLPRTIRETLLSEGFNIPVPRLPSEDIREKLKQSADKVDVIKLFGNIVTQDQDMFAILNNIWKIRDASHPVLITGETGTGKELIAQAIHNTSRRSRGNKTKFIAVNCAAISQDIAEAELFGHVAGAFTGATEDRKGVFEAMNGGTVFLDEVEALSPKLQRLLLRVLETGEIRPVGANRHKQVSVRIVAASNEDLVQKVELGEFRKDLYHRLNVVSFNLPALRERPGDIPLLAEYFCEKYAIRLTPAALELLKKLYWEGNIRELETMVLRLAETAGTPVVDIREVEENIEKAEIRRIRSIEDFKMKLSLYISRQTRKGEKLNFPTFWIQEVEKPLFQELQNFFNGEENFLASVRPKIEKPGTQASPHQNIFIFEPEFAQELLLSMLVPSSFQVAMHQLKRSVLKTLFERGGGSYPEVLTRLELSSEWFRTNMFVATDDALRERFLNDKTWKPMNVPEKFQDKDMRELSMSDWLMRHYVTWKQDGITLTEIAAWCSTEPFILISGLRYLGVSEDYPEQVVRDSIIHYFKSRGMKTDAARIAVQLPFSDRLDQRERFLAGARRINNRFRLDRIRGSDRARVEEELGSVADHNGWRRPLPSHAGRVHVGR